MITPQAISGPVGPGFGMEAYGGMDIGVQQAYIPAPEYVQPNQYIFRQPIQYIQRIPQQWTFDYPPQNLYRQPVQYIQRIPQQWSFDYPPQNLYRQPPQWVITPQAISGPVGPGFGMEAYGGMDIGAQQAYIPAPEYVQPNQYIFRQPIQYIQRIPQQWTFDYPPQNLYRQPVQYIQRMPQQWSFDYPPQTNLPPAGPVHPAHAAAVELRLPTAEPLPPATAMGDHTAGDQRPCRTWLRHGGLRRDGHRRPAGVHPGA